MVAFETDFMKDLEDRLNNPFHAIPYTAWNPRAVLAPERHYSMGILVGKTRGEIAQHIENNAALQDIESLLQVPIGLPKTNDIHPVKEQVWLWGHVWLTKYLEYLAKPNSLKSEFYRTNNDKFISLLRAACNVNPASRPTFPALLRQWNPKHFSSISSSGEELYDPSTIDLPPQSSASASVSVSVSVSPQTPIGARGNRLVLTSRSSSEGRNKTRKSLHSSNRSPVGDNHGSPSEG